MASKDTPGTVTIALSRRKNRDRSENWYSPRGRIHNDEETAVSYRRQQRWDAIDSSREAPSYRGS